MNKFGITDSLTIGEMHPLFKGLLWVLAARSTDGTRSMLMNVLIERSKKDYHIVATDGRRMHVSTYDPGLFDDDIDVLEPGLYELIAKSTKCIVLAASEQVMRDYPKWRNLISDRQDPVHWARVSSDSLSIISIRTGAALATSFLQAAIGFGTALKKDESVTVYFDQAEYGAPVLIKHDLGKAIVMPLRLGEDDQDKEHESDEDATPDIPEIALTFVPLVKAMDDSDKEGIL